MKPEIKQKLDSILEKYKDKDMVSNYQEYAYQNGKFIKTYSPYVPMKTTKYKIKTK